MSIARGADPYPAGDRGRKGGEEEAAREEHRENQGARRDGAMEELLLSTVQDQWLPALKELVASINEKFSAAFERTYRPPPGVVVAS